MVIIDIFPKIGEHLKRLRSEAHSRQFTSVQFNNGSHVFTHHTKYYVSFTAFGLFFFPLLKCWLLSLLCSCMTLSQKRALPRWPFIPVSKFSPVASTPAPSESSTLPVQSCWRNTSTLPIAQLQPHDTHNVVHVERGSLLSVTGGTNMAPGRPQTCSKNSAIIIRHHNVMKISKF